MEANELYCLSISPVVENPFALEWSQDNHVSLITHRGVHIFELVPRPMCIYPTLQFWRTFVYPSEFLPAEPFANWFNNALWKTEREECCNLLAQSAITPKIEDRMDAEPVITRVAWSPVKLMETSKCLLAILTSVGSVEILHKLGKNWFSVWNLSSRWYETIKAEYGIDPPDSTKLNEFAKTAWSERISSLLCTAIAWSPLFEPREQSPCAYLASVFSSCDLAIFRAERSSEFSKAKEPTVAYKTKLETRGKVSEMLWVPLQEERNVIIMGYVDGQIHGVSLKLSNGTFRDEKLFKYHDHSDRIAISSIKLMHKTSDHGTILVTKSCWLLVLNVDASGECLETRQLRLGTTFITGVTTLSNEKVMVTCRSSKMYVVTVRESGDLTSETVRSDLKSKKVQYLGLARSPNATILVNVTSPDGMYDHLIHREPSALQMFGLSGDEWNPWHIINTREDVSLYEYWDCLESIRVKAARSLDPAKELPEIPRNLERLSVHKLRIVMWLTLISQVLEKKQMLKGVEKIVGEISEAQPLIFLTSASEHLRRLAKKSALTVDERRCVSFLRMFMEIYIAGEEEEEEEEEEQQQQLRNVDIWRGVNEALALTSHLDSIETEACNICGEILTDFPWRIERCPAGHKITRCSVTLLQITWMKYRICPICGRMFHPSLDAIYRETRCLYCDVPVQYDSRLISNALGDVDPHWRNLSKRPALILEPKSHDNENLSVGEKNKRRSLNPQTFAVIVNRDDDDSYITETWQQF